MSIDKEFHAAHQDLNAFVDAFEKHVKEYGEPKHGQLMVLTQDIKKDAQNISTGMISTSDAVDIQSGKITPVGKAPDPKPLLARGLTRIQDAAKSLAVNLADAGKQVRSMVKDKVNGADQVAKAWDNVLDATSHYMTMGMKRLTGLAHGRDPKDRYALGFASGHLQSAQDIALDQRKRGILQTLKHPGLGEFVLQDAKRLGMIAESKPVHRGTVQNVIGLEAILKNAKGQLLALPVTPDFKFKAGDNLVMKDRGDGFYSGKRQMVERGMER
ncbi:hypothetical protein [Acidithiobacillus thiooxidans]|uniref:Uncharacterized protein n=1 Tax=Acidithiobacillus thiooxidans TaxID=930 RepID=A0A1C2IQ51_ACITH|nr:hypothetical protein [Acidithiobacillus thiooxidans]OCX75545.1 hypothetical protein A6M23_02010 [Acidithiobacillus thiooxidans]OCX78196.1 hypothetical protein A6P08_19975 [Acidithiobacillus thiooxidans]